MAQESWLNGEFQAEDMQKAAILNAGAIASTQVCAGIAAMIEDIKFGETTEEDEK